MEVDASGQSSTLRCAGLILAPRPVRGWLFAGARPVLYRGGRPWRQRRSRRQELYLGPYALSGSPKDYFLFFSVKDLLAMIYASDHFFLDNPVMFSGEREKDLVSRTNSLRYYEDENFACYVRQ